MRAQRFKQKPSAEDIIEDDDEIKSLGVAVVYRALSDLFLMKDGKVKSLKLTSKDNPEKYTRHNAEALEAFHFLTNMSGEWYQSRIHWCEIADMDEDSIRDYTLKHYNRIRDESKRD